MAQWTHMTQLIQFLPPQTVNELYPSPNFPIEVRHYLATWIEEQSWEEFDLEKIEQEDQARALLDQIITMLQALAQQNNNVVEKMKLMHISQNMTMFQKPLQFAVMVRETLRKERVLINTAIPLPTTTLVL